VLRLQDAKDPEVLRKEALILERENERLFQMVLELQRKVLELQGKGDAPQQLRLRLAELEQQLAVRNRVLVGPKSERSGDQTGQQPDKPKVNKGRGEDVPVSRGPLWVAVQVRKLQLSTFVVMQNIKRTRAIGQETACSTLGICGYFPGEAYQCACTGRFPWARSCSAVDPSHRRSGSDSLCSWRCTNSDMLQWPVE